jgi:hypothetical protein
MVVWKMTDSAPIASPLTAAATPVTGTGAARPSAIASATPTGHSQAATRTSRASRSRPAASWPATRPAVRQLLITPKAAAPPR